MLRSKITRSATPDRSFQVNGKPCQEFDCSVDAIGMAGNPKLVGLTWNLPDGVSLNDAIKSRGITQDPATKLLSVPTSLMPAETKQYANAQGQITAAIFPDHAEEYNEVHIIAGPTADVQAFQQQLDSSGLGLLVAGL